MNIHRHGCYLGYALQIVDWQLELFEKQSKKHMNDVTICRSSSDNSDWCESLSADNSTASAADDDVTSLSRAETNITAQTVQSPLHIILFYIQTSRLAFLFDCPDSPNSSTQRSVWTNTLDVHWPCLLNVFTLMWALPCNCFTWRYLSQCSTLVLTLL